MLSQSPSASFPCSPFQPSYLPSPCLGRPSGTCWALPCCESLWTTAGWTQVSVCGGSQPIASSVKQLPLAPSKSGQRTKASTAKVHCHLAHSSAKPLRKPEADTEHLLSAGAVLDALRGMLQKKIHFPPSGSFQWAATTAHPGGEIKNHSQQPEVVA